MTQTQDRLTTDVASVIARDIVGLFDLAISREERILDFIRMVGQQVLQVV